MKMWPRILLFFIGLCLHVFAVHGAPSECLKDSDCVPAACCQSTICSNIVLAERGCRKKECPEQCTPFTLDCGGRCECTPEHRCAAILGHGGGPDREKKSKSTKSVKTSVKK